MYRLCPAFSFAPQEPRQGKELPSLGGIVGQERREGQRREGKLIFGFVLTPGGVHDLDVLSPSTRAGHQCRAEPGCGQELPREGVPTQPLLCACCCHGRKVPVLCSKWEIWFLEDVVTAAQAPQYLGLGRESPVAFQQGNIRLAGTIRAKDSSYK